MNRARGAALRELMRQAAPMILSRAGLAAMTMVAAALTARHDAHELAALNLAEGAFGRLVDIFMAAVLSGAVLIAGARAPQDAARRFVSWRRAVAASLALGCVGLLAATQAPAALALAGQSPELIERAAPVIRTMALGLPFGLVAVACAVHLEAIGRAALVARWMLGANLLNFVLGAALIGGAFGFSPMGARGAATAAAVVRIALALGLVATLRAVEGPGLFLPAGRPVAPGRQLALAGSAAGTSAGMHALGVWLTIFAGWLGALPLAAYASAWTLNLPGFVLALGVADAIAIRAAARGGDERETHSDLLALFAALAAIGFVLAAFSGPIASAYAIDPALQSRLAQVLPLSAMALFLDGSSLGVFSVLRARGDIVAPTAIQIGSMAVTAPLAWTLATHFGLGVPGLFLAILPTSAIRLALMSARLFRAPPALQLSETSR